MMAKDSFTPFDALVRVFSRDYDNEEVHSKSDNETEEEREKRLSGTLIPTDELERMEGIYRDKNGNILRDNHDKISEDKNVSISRRRMLRWLSKRPMPDSDVVMTSTVHEKNIKPDLYQEWGYFADGNSNSDEERKKLVKRARKSDGVSKNQTSASRRTSTKNDGASTSGHTKESDIMMTSAMHEKKRKPDLYQEWGYYFADRNANSDEERNKLVKRARKSDGISKNQTSASRRTSTKNDGASTSGHVKESDIVMTSAMHEKKRKREKHRVLEFSSKDESTDKNPYSDKKRYESVKKARKDYNLSKIRSSSKDGASTSGSAKNNRGIFKVPNPAPPLPNYVRARMEINGPLNKEPILVIQRILTETDLKENNNRLQLPYNQVLNKNFLTESEYTHLRTFEVDEETGENKTTRECIPANIIMPSLTRGRITLKIWDMTKPGSTRICEVFAFNGDWKKLVANEETLGKELVVGMVLQVWAYRVNGGLNFALVNLGAFTRDHIGNIVQLQLLGNNDAQDQIPVNVVQDNVVQVQLPANVDAQAQLPEHNNKSSEEHDSLEEDDYLEEHDAAVKEDDSSEEHVFFEEDN